MPSFEFTSPEGKKYSVAGPEGATKEQAWGILQKQLTPAALGAKDVPGGGTSDKLAPVAREPSAWERVKGVPEAAVALGQGALAGLAARATALVDPAAGLKVHEALSPNVSPGAQANLDTLGKVAEKTGIDKMAGLGPMAMPGGLATNLAKPAARQVGRSVEADALKAIPGKLADVVTPRPPAELAALAKKAEAMGIELRPDMLSSNKFARMVGEALEQVPLSGSKADQRQMAFNSALTKIIGGDTRAKRLTPDVFDGAMTKSGEKIGQISSETPIRVDADMRNAFNNMVQEAAKFETADVAKIVSNYVQEMDGVAVNGVIPGETFRKLNSKIGRQIRATNNGDLKNALYEVQERMHDALEKNIASPERLAELKEARFQYAMGKVIEPLVAKAKGGDISPQALMGAVTSDGAKKTMMARGRGGDIGDLARIGQAFLKEPASSGTAERGLAYGGILGGGALAAPTTTAGIVAAANAYNRLGPKLTKRAINVRDVDPQAQAPWNIGQP